MYAVQAGADPELLHEALSLLQTAGLAFFAGWAAEKLLDTGLRIRGLPLLCGLSGLYLGTWTWTLAGWPHGPRLADQALVPGFIGALAVATVFKLIGLGVEGPRR
jgi:uncharacterized membrane protein YeaQ/YmgE (transglycosylase-associated protein family)